MLAANEKGLDAYKRGDYEAAAGSFREALRYVPDEPTVTRNLENAEYRLREQRERVAQQKREAEASAAIRQGVERLSATLGLEGPAARPSAPTAASGLDFMRDAPASTATAAATPNYDAMVVDARGTRPAAGTTAPATSQPLGFMTSIDRVPVPSPPAQTARASSPEVARVRVEEARQKWTQAVKDSNVRDQLKDARDLYLRGYTDEADVRSKALLEKVRADALEDLKKDVQRQKTLKAARVPSDEDTELLFEALFARRLTNSELMRRVQQRVEEKRLGVQLPREEDLDFLLERPGRQWPGSKNPQAPLPNPLAEEKKRRDVQRIVRQMEREDQLVDFIVGTQTFWSEMLQMEAEKATR
jgi:hypothetical protein